MVKTKEVCLPESLYIKLKDTNQSQISQNIKEDVFFFTSYCVKDQTILS